MGCTASKISPSKSANRDGRSNQDVAKSFVSKVGAIRMLLKNSKSREAYIKYLREENKLADVEYVEYVQDADDILKSMSGAINVKAIDMIKKLKGSKTEGAGMILESLESLPSKELSAGNEHEIMHFMSKSQADIISTLAPSFNQFTRSDAYKAWLKESENNERENFKRRQSSQIIDIGRLPSCSVKYPSVLIVDDSAVTVKIASYSLTRDGHTVVAAKTGKDGLQMMTASRYDIVLLDLNLPLMNGLEVVRAYRQFEQDKIAKLENTVTITEGDMAPAESPKSRRLINLFSPRVAPEGLASLSSRLFSSSQKKKAIELKKAKSPVLIIGMSVNDDDGLRNDSIAAGMNAFITKPFNIAKFVETVLRCENPEEANPQTSAPSVNPP